MTIPEMEAFVEKLLDGRQIRERMGDHEIRLIAEHFEGGRSSSLSQSRRSRSPNRRRGRGRRRGTYEDDFDSLNDSFDDLENDDMLTMDEDDEYDEFSVVADKRAETSKGYITGRDLKRGVSRKFNPPNKIRRKDAMKMDLDKLHSTMHAGSGMLTSVRVMRNFIKKLISAIKESATDQNRGRVNWRKAYQIFDKDRTGRVTEGCLKDALAELGLSKGLSKSDTGRIMQYFDQNRDGVIDRREFRDACCSPINIDPRMFNNQDMMYDDYDLEDDLDYGRAKNSRFKMMILWT